MKKELIKSYLIIFFIVVELLSMIFNFFLVKIYVFEHVYYFNFSVIFFCLGFFIVDIVADNFSPEEAEQFIFYKIFSQLSFLILGNIAIQASGIEGTQLAKILDKSIWMIATGFISTYVSFKVMIKIMSDIKIKIYQGNSVFRRYLYSTIPAEILFSFIFTILCFYRYESFAEIKDLLITSCFVKTVMSFIFASIISVLAKIKYIKNFEIQLKNNSINKQGISLQEGHRSTQDLD